MIDAFQIVVPLYIQSTLDGRPSGELKVIHILRGGSFHYVAGEEALRTGKGA
jgi:hypothetical protein